MSTQLTACENVVGNWDFLQEHWEIQESFFFPTISLNWVSVHVFSQQTSANFYFITIITIVDLFLCLLFLSKVYADCQVPNPVRIMEYFVQSFVLGHQFSGWHSKHMPIVYLRSWAVLTMPRKLYCSSWNCHVWNN